MCVAQDFSATERLRALVIYYSGEYTISGLLQSHWCGPARVALHNAFILPDDASG